MVWTFKNLDELAKWLRIQASNSRATAMAQTAHKRVRFHEGEASAYTWLAEAIEGNSIILEVEDAAIEAREAILSTFGSKAPNKLAAAKEKLNECLNIKHRDRHLAKKKELANAPVSSDPSGSAEPAQTPTQ